MALLTYVVASLLFWYLGVMPDLATLRDRARGRVGQVMYGFFAMGFRGSGPQWRHLKATYGVLAAIMAPLVVSVHSIVGLDFAGRRHTGLAFHRISTVLRVRCIVVRAGDSAAADTGVAPSAGPLRPTSPSGIFKVMAKLLLTSSLCMSYAYVMDAFEPFYIGKLAERIEVPEPHLR